MILSFEFLFQSKVASAGNRTRAARVAGEHSTTEPTMPTYLPLKGQLRSYFHTESMHAELPGSR